MKSLETLTRKVNLLKNDVETSHGRSMSVDKEDVQVEVLYIAEAILDVLEEMVEVKASKGDSVND